MHEQFSVLMPVHYKDDPKHLKESLLSIYDNQTLKPSEIVIIADGPLPLLLERIILDFKSKIKDKISFNYYVLPENKGLAFALNEGLRLCRNEWVARMDADDISRYHRFEKQWRFIVNNPQIDIIGGYILEFDEKMKKKIGIRKVPVCNEDIITFAKYRSPFNHMTVMYKRNKILSIGGYPVDLKKMQDYALWCKAIVSGLKMANLPTVLVDVRAGRSFIRRRKGITYLKYELLLQRHLRKIGFWSRKDFLMYGIPRVLLRLLPEGALETLYFKFLRGKG